MQIYCCSSNAPHSLAHYSCNHFAQPLHWIQVFLLFGSPCALHWAQHVSSFEPAVVLLDLECANFFDKGSSSELECLMTFFAEIDFFLSLSVSFNCRCFLLTVLTSADFSLFLQSTAFSFLRFSSSDVSSGVLNGEEVATTRCPTLRLFLVTRPLFAKWMSESKTENWSTSASDMETMFCSAGEM